MSRTLALFTALLLIAGAAAAQTGSVEVRDAWARATPGKADIGAAYLTLESPTDDRLTGLVGIAPTLVTGEDTSAGCDLLVVRETELRIGRREEVDLVRPAPVARRRRDCRRGP